MALLLATHVAGSAACSNGDEVQCLPDSRRMLFLYATRFRIQDFTRVTMRIKTPNGQRRMCVYQTLNTSSSALCNIFHLHDSTLSLIFVTQNILTTFCRGLLVRAEGTSSSRTLSTLLKAAWHRSASTQEQLDSLPVGY